MSMGASIWTAVAAVSAAIAAGGSCWSAYQQRQHAKASAQNQYFVLCVRNPIFAAIEAFVREAKLLVASEVPRITALRQSASTNDETSREAIQTTTDAFMRATFTLRAAFRTASSSWNCDNSFLSSLTKTSSDLMDRVAGDIADADTRAAQRIIDNIDRAAAAWRAVIMNTDPLLLARKRRTLLGDELRRPQ